MAQLKRTLKCAVSLIVRGFDVTAEQLRRLVGRAPAGRCVVIYYHSVPAEQRARFAGQMDVLLRLATPLSTAEQAALKQGERYVMVTFDDGFFSVKENALPELRKRGIPSTIFVPSGCLGQQPDWLRHARGETARDRVMTAAELRALAAESLVTIGSHTVGHVNLAEVVSIRSQAELSESKSQLETALGRPILQFSYPFGGRNRELDEYARKVGYARLFSSEPSCSFDAANTFLTGRVSVEPDDWPIEFRLKILGAYRWGAWLQAGKRRLKRSHGG